MTADPAAHAPESQPDSAPIAKPLATYTDADQRTVAEFRDWMERAELSQAEMARRLEISTGTLSGLLACQYKGAKAKYISRMRAMLDRHRARQAATPRPAFKFLSTSEAIFGFLARCDANRLMGFLNAPTGGCKTSHLQQFARLSPDSAVYLACVRGQAPRDLCLALGAAIGLEPAGTQAALVNAVIRRLLALGQPVILVDECDDLGPSGLRILQQIHDRAGCAVILAGTIEFIRALRSRRSGTAGQALSRMRHFHVPPISDDDARDLLDGYPFNDGAFNALWAATKPDVRRLIDAANIALDEAGKGRQIGLPHVAEALKTEMPRDI